MNRLCIIEVMSDPARIRGFVFPVGAPPVPVNSWDALTLENGGKGFVWIDLEGELESEAESALASRMGWHPVVLQNIRQPNIRPRLTPFDDYNHLTLHIPSRDTLHEEGYLEVDVVLSGHYLATFHREPETGVDQLLEELSSSKTSPRSPDLLLYRLLSRAVEALAPTVDTMDDVLNVLEEDALYHPSPDLIERIVQARDELFLLHLSLGPQLQVTHDLTSGTCRFITPYARPYFKSLENRLRGLIDDIAIYKEVAQNILELYRSAITQKTNEIIRVLTVVSTPILVLSLFTGLYGMNVPLPFSNRPHVFIVMLGISVVTFLGMLWWFRRRQWF